MNIRESDGGQVAESLGRISVVMCTFNGEPFVRQQLQSILDQTLPPTEVIISDDGSTDETLEIVRSMAKTSIIPIKIHANSSRLGFSENFLHACDYVDSPYIAFSDQDDIWFPRKLERSFNALTTAGARLCAHTVERIDSRGDRIEGPPLPLDQTGVIHPLHSHPWGNFLGFTMLFQRSLLDYFPRHSRGNDPHSHGSPLSHDRWIYFLASTFGRIVVLEESFAEYRQHDAQLYGGVKGRSMAERVTTKLANGREQARYLSGVAAHRAALLESLLPTGGPSSDHCLRSGGHGTRESASAVWWRTIQSHLARSSRLYDCATVRQRVALMLKSIFSGCYRSFEHAGLGRGRLIEDVSVLVLISLPGDFDWTRLARIEGAFRQVRHRRA